MKKKFIPTKMIIFILAVLFGHSNSISPIIIVPPQPNYGAQIGSAVGNCIGIGILALAAQKAKQESDHQIRTAYLNYFAATIPEPRISECIGAAQKENYFLYILLFIIVLISIPTSLLFFKKIRS